MRTSLTLFAFAAAVLVASSASAQYEPFSLGAGFLPDPMVGTGTTGGAVDADVHGEGCVGMVADSPDHTLTIESEVALSIWVESDADATLVVTSGRASWCDDDSHGGLNPQVDVVLAPGEYQIYVGNLGESGAYTIYLSENL